MNRNLDKFFFASSAFFFLSIFIVLPSNGQQLQSPEAFLGYPMGKHYTYHHKGVAYFEHLASVSPLVSVARYGESSEGRPLIYAIVAADGSQEAIEKFRKAHLQRTGMISEGLDDPGKSMIWMGFNVHGNEASAMETAMWMLYYLALDDDASRAWLKDMVVGIDPCMNPDGHSRYVNWYRMVSTSPPDPNPLGREHFEPWPNGRSNHYMFDLNRDWVWQTQHESRQRLALYHEWMPQVHIDFHEQGYDVPYFFGPGAKPIHKLIENWQREFQTHIGKEIGAKFDEKNWRYFTDERFDLLYPGYGDTYPGLNGSIGLTFEMGGNTRAGSAVITARGDTLALQHRVSMHLQAALSTLDACKGQSDLLVRNFRKYFADAAALQGAYVVKKESANIEALKELLTLNKITYGYAEQTANLDGYNFFQNKKAKYAIGKGDVVVPKGQIKGKLVQVLFEKETYLEDSLTYDITAWALPYVYNAETIELSIVPITIPNASVGVEPSSAEIREAIAWLIAPNGVASHQLIANLHKHKIRAEVVTIGFEYNGQKFAPGTLLVTKAENIARHGDLNERLVNLAKKCGLQPVHVKSGFRFGGLSLGSSYFEPLVKPTVGIYYHPGRSYLNDVGEIWHYFEQRLEYPVSLLNMDHVNVRDLGDFDLLIIPSGRYGSQINEDKIAGLKSWMQSGGRLILLENAMNEFAGEKGFGYTEIEESKSDSVDYTPWLDRERQYISKTTQGSIIKATIDNSHPLAYGFDKTHFTIKNNDLHYHPVTRGHNVIYTTRNPEIVAGFAGTKYRPKLASNMLTSVIPFGGGRVVLITDNPLFRGFWEQGTVLFGNAVFMPGM
ncbi:MAG: M14 family zinc carboxypeptidase [Cyclobacteriaceae bacterium]